MNEKRKYTVFNNKKLGDAVVNLHMNHLTTSFLFCRFFAE